MNSQHTQPLNTSVLYNAYKHSQKRLFLFDYDVSLLKKKYSEIGSCNLFM